MIRRLSALRSRYGKSLGASAKTFHELSPRVQGGIRRPDRNLRIVAAQQAESDVLDGSGEEEVVSFSNSADDSCTVMNVCGRNDTVLLMQLTALLETKGIVVASANLNTFEHGAVCNIFRITEIDGAKVRQLSRALCRFVSCCNVSIV